MTCPCEKMMVGGHELVVVPDPDCRRHGIREGVMAIPHLRRHARTGEDNRATEARLYAESFAPDGARRRVPAATVQGGTTMIEQREGRPHEVADTYVPTVHGSPSEGYLHSGDGNPVLDQAEGTTAAAEMAQARREIEGQLGDGTLNLEDLFQMDEQESGDSGRIIGHLHVRAALLALKGIGPKKADAVLSEVGVPGDRHVASLGARQREQLVAAVADHL